MKSKFTDYFNHDADALNYDDDVINESHPVRSGYSALLSWAGRQVHPSDSVLDLGCGTGNTVLAIPEVKEIICVDISANMLEIAKRKLAHLHKVTFVQSDLLEFFDNRQLCLDTVISTYTIHHLTGDEKYELFKRIHKVLQPGGRALFGDLMFKNKRAKETLKKKFAKTHPDIVEDMEDEFYWDIDGACSQFCGLGFSVRTTRFSELSWGIRAEV